MNEDSPFFQSSPESSMKLHKRTDRQTGRQTDEWRLPLFQIYLKVPWSCAGWQTDKQTDEPRVPFFQSSPESSMKLCRRTDKQTDEPRLSFFQWLPESSLKLCRTDRQTDRRTKTSIFSSGYLRVQRSCAGGQTDRWSRTVPLPVHWPQTVCWWRWCKTQPACPCTHSTAHLQHNHQGMTIRTARLPGAGNLLGRAGEDLSGLPDQESRYQVIFYWQYISIQALDFESLWQFLFHGSTIATSVSFYIIKLTDFSVVACDWLASAVKPIRS